MKPWLEDLSEEWIAQPTTSPPAPTTGHAEGTQTSQSVPPKPHSRLPRMRHSSGSFSEIQLRHLAKDQKPLPKARSALAERSRSDINVSVSLAEDSPNPSLGRSTARSASSASLNSIDCAGTVAQKPITHPHGQDKALYDTPEWRRRLLNGDIGYGAQKDLFSPMGLENMFAKPAGSTSEDTKQSKSKLSFFKGLNAMPSSPPPWPTDVSQKYTPRRITEDEGFADESSQAGKPQQEDLSTVTGPSEDSLNGPLRPRQDSLYPSESHDDGDKQPTRTVSGQLEFENESFSPVFLSINHKVDDTPAPPNFRGSALADRLRHIGSPPAAIPEIVSDDNGFSDSREESYAKPQDDTLPEDLPAGTPDIADVGLFVEMRRGGYSRDGSFRRRPLSPSPQGKTARGSAQSSENTPDGSVRVNRKNKVNSEEEQPTSPRQLAPTPVTPHRGGAPTHLSPDRAQSGSPLKLFGAHDTFTSNRLQRRLSQLEYQSEKTATTSTEGNGTQSTRTTKKSSQLTSVEEVSIQKMTAHANEVSSTSAKQPTLPPVETFGQGHHDEFQFSESFSCLSQDVDVSLPDDSPSSDVAPPGSRQPLRFQYDGSPQSLSNSRTRQGLIRVSQPVRVRNMSRSLSMRKSSALTAEDPSAATQYADGKRGPTSPFKNPTPKRRRTTQSIANDSEEDDVFSDSGLKTVQDTHTAMQSVIGRKRKDARHEHGNNTADPEVLARRHILRPRNPTPSQRRRDELQAEILEATEAFILSSPKLNTIREQLDSPSGPGATSEASRAAAVANEVAAFTMRRTQAMKDETRKKSVTTQDFLDEAVKIMEFIRTKGRPTSGLGSLEESEHESPADEDADPLPSTPLTFSRPPSREGRMSGWREPNKQELNPQVMSHLEKFQEIGSDDFIGSSIRSLGFGRMNVPAASEDHSVVVEQDNIRITDNRNRRNEHHGSHEGTFSSEPRSLSTHPSAGSSLGQTVVTTGSRRSERVANVAPEAVAHLIPEQVGGMSFDREKGLWVKKRSPKKEQPPVADTSGTNASEDDPFGNIPDLSVDETAELVVHKSSPTRPKATAETFLEDSEDCNAKGEVRPSTRDGKPIPSVDGSSVPSKASNNFAWSYPKTETRATSYSDQATQRGGTQKLQQPPTTFAIPESDEEDIEHEIKYFEGRDTAPQNVHNTRLRDITISISSPQPQQNGYDEQDAEDPLNHRWGGRWTQGISTTRAKSNARKVTWHQVTGAKTLPTRVPPMGEDPELSILEDLPSRNYRMQLSMSVNAPALGHDAVVTNPSSPVKTGDVTFMLSDLPEFTLHQIDECELPNRVVVKHDGTKFSKSLEDRYALGTAELVKALQDAEPDEPYWEDLRAVDLHDKGLTNLHRLDEFCYRLEELDVSDNGISQIKGAPYTIRRLQAKNNCLTGLTSWLNLMNLQHLDISGNEIDNLEGLSQLVHLRTLNADGNQISSLGGVLQLDGLMKLSLEGNNIESVDFETANLKSLVDLNLRGNGLIEVHNLHCLPQLQHLDLDDNCIDEFPLSDAPAARCNSLRSLRICRNSIASMYLSTYCPKLESLYVDGNALTSIAGLDRLRNLRTFSAREQILDTDSDCETCVTNLVRNAEIRNLYISNNPTRGLELSQHMLNLQRLELSSMALKELPDNFGQLAPNARSINLNFNALKDLRPLLNIKRLTELVVAGNRLSRLRTTLAVLAKLPTLTILDLRENPLTTRFYAPTVENKILSLRHKPDYQHEESEASRFVLPEGDQEADTRYLARLDDETRLRRRVHEMMLATSCRNLRTVDGLTWDKGRVLMKDEVWERLVFLGVIRKAGKGVESVDT